MVANAGDNGRPAISSLDSPPIIAVELCREHLVCNIRIKYLFFLQLCMNLIEIRSGAGIIFKYIMFLSCDQMTTDHFIHLGMQVNSFRGKTVTISFVPWLYLCCFNLQTILIGLLLIVWLLIKNFLIYLDKKCKKLWNVRFSFTSMWNLTLIHTKLRFCFINGIGCHIEIQDLLSLVLKYFWLQGVHPCDRRRNIRDYQFLFPAVDFSLASAG